MRVFWKGQVMQKIWRERKNTERKRILKIRQISHNNESNRKIYILYCLLAAAFVFLYKI